MFFKRKEYKLREESLKERIFDSVHAADYQVEEYQWHIKNFGNIFLKINNGIEEHIFILDRDEYIIDSKPAILSFNNKEILGFNCRQIYFVLMVEGFLRK